MKLDNLLHFPTAVHVAIPEFTNVLLPTVLVREPEHLTIAMETTIFESTFVESAGGLLSKFTTRERERERERESESVQ